MPIWKRPCQKTEYIIPGDFKTKGEAILWALAHKPEGKNWQLYASARGSRDYKPVSNLNESLHVNIEYLRQHIRRGISWLKHLTTL